MILNEDHLITIRSWLDKHNYSCPICSSNEIWVNQKLLAVVPIDVNGADYGKPRPLIGVICDKCQYISFFIPTADILEGKSDRQ